MVEKYDHGCGDNEQGYRPAGQHINCKMSKGRFQLKNNNIYLMEFSVMVGPPLVIEKNIFFEVNPRKILFYLPNKNVFFSIKGKGGPDTHPPVWKISENKCFFYY
jgi:hypothetical protein